MFNRILLERGLIDFLFALGYTKKFSEVVLAFHSGIISEDAEGKI